HAHRNRGGGGPRVALAARAEDARGTCSPPDGDGEHAGRAAAKPSRGAGRPLRRNRRADLVRRPGRRGGPPGRDLDAADRQRNLAAGGASNGDSGADREAGRAELEQLLVALEAARDGDFRVRLPAGGRGITADLRRAFNELADRRETFSKEVARLGRAIGPEG